MAKRVSILKLSSVRLEKAYESVQLETHTLRRSTLIAVNVDPVAAALTARTALPRLHALRKSLSESIADFDVGLIDQLDRYSLALIHSHHLLLHARLPNHRLEELMEKATLLREKHRADVLAFLKLDLVNDCRPKPRKNGDIYYDLACELMVLVYRFRNGWSSIARHCAISNEMIDQTEIVADDLLRAAGEENNRPTTIAHAKLARQKIFTLFARTYDELRRAVTYVRWDQNDSAQITPSLYGNLVKTKHPKTTPSSDYASTTTMNDSLTTLDEDILDPYRILN
jgi:hypothetical protein